MFSYVSDEDLERKADPEKYEWKQERITSLTNVNNLEKPYIIQCSNCRAHYLIDYNCKKCGPSAYIHPHPYHDSSLGIFCTKCGDGFEKWSCEKCGAENNVATTFFYRKTKSKCFIASAVYESANAPEVIYLQRVRDEILLNSGLGKIFVRIYYFVSPTLADCISENARLKKRLKERILSPLISYIQKFFTM